MRLSDNGFVSVEAREAILELGWAVRGLKYITPTFSDDKIRMMQSFNRYTEEIHNVAAKVQKKIAQQPQDKREFVWRGFIDVKMSEMDKANMQAWDITDQDVWDGIAQYCEAGVKVTMVWSPQQKAFICSGVGQANAGVNAGWCVTAFAKDPYSAARTWLFKVATMLPADWTEYQQPDGNDFG